jgi:hypothetical protein
MLLLLLVHLILIATTLTIARIVNLRNQGSMQLPTNTRANQLVDRYLRHLQSTT